jgi:hypothetical protein
MLLRILVKLSLVQQNEFLQSKADEAKTTKIKSSKSCPALYYQTSSGRVSACLRSRDMQLVSGCIELVAAHEGRLSTFMVVLLAQAVSEPEDESRVLGHSCIQELASRNHLGFFLRIETVFSSIIIIIIFIMALIGVFSPVLPQKLAFLYQNR